MVAFGHVDFEQVGRAKLRDEGRRKREREREGSRFLSAAAPR